MAVHNKFFNYLQPEWYKYVTNVCLSKNLAEDSYDTLFDHLQQYEGIVNASRVKRVVKTHDPLALVANTYATICDDQEDILTTSMMLLACAITQRYSTPTNNRLHTYSITRNQAVVQADRVDIQRKNVGNGGRYVRRTTDNQGDSARNRNVKKEYCPKARVRDSKYFLEQMLLAKKDEAGIMLNAEQNDFLFANAPEIEELKDLSATICMMARLQQADNDSENGPNYDSEFISEGFRKRKEELQINISKEIKQSLQLKNECASLKHKFNKQKDSYLDDILNFEEKVKKNENVVVKMSNSIQAMFMLGPKPNFFYDPKLKHGLGYKNHYTLKKAISVNPNLYDASFLYNSTVHVDVCDTENILEDATKSQLKMKGKLEDPIAIEKKVKFGPVNYAKMNDLYETFVPQVELSLEQNNLSEASTSNVTHVIANASKLSSPPLEMPKLTFVDREDSILRKFCYNEVKPILDYLHAIFKVIQKEFPKDVQVMMNVFESMESELDDTLKQNKLLNDRLLEATLTHDVEKCVLMHSESKNDNLSVEI
ncbi:hypothetical protein Tco_1070438 [Tanacetum coccineum]|uniref:Uncharacterized protein n=1 Tax=Tanacetum coccineum TaxID=301880 RepID=A0ABQ5HMS6_9ASTR